MKTFQNKSLLFRTVSLILTVGLCLSFCLAVKAADLLSYPIKTAIAAEEKTQRGEITVEMSSGDSLRQADYQALRDTHKPVTLRFSDISWAMVPHDMGRRMKASSMDLWLVEPEKALVEAVCDKTGLEETQFQLVQPGYLGALPAVCTVGICLDQEFMNYNGTKGLNLYALEFQEKAETVQITRLGLYSTDNEAEQAISPWLYLKTNYSRVFLITGETLPNVQPMECVAVFEDSGEAQRVDGDANPDTGDNTGICLVLVVAILSLGVLSVILLRGSINKK